MTTFASLDPNKTGRQAENLESTLRDLIVGQDEAIHQIVRAYQTHLAGLSPVGRPIGNFLFLGPTGCWEILVPSSKSIARSFNTAMRSRS
jgi:hypothetical protein